MQSNWEAEVIETFSYYLSHPCVEGRREGSLEGKGYESGYAQRKKERVTNELLPQLLLSSLLPATPLLLSSFPGNCSDRGTDVRWEMKGIVNAAK